MKKSILTSVIVGGIVFLVSHVFTFERSGDFTWTWYAGRMLLEGKNPYHMLPATDTYPLDEHLYYPIYPVLFSIPFSFLVRELAAPLFISGSCAMLTYILMRQKCSIIDVFFTFSSVSFVFTLHACQWSVLLSAIPFLWFLKPNIGLIALSTLRTTKGLVHAFGFFLLITLWSYVQFPWWIDSWLHVITHHRHSTHHMPFVHFVPLLVPAFLLLIHVRTMPLALTAFVPQSIIYYDQFIFFSLFRSTAQRGLYWAIEWFGFALLALFDFPNKFTVVVATTFFPAYMLALYNRMRGYYV